jgi:hypothetical protein
MLDTLTAYSQVIQTGTSILMVLIWLVYLQIFLMAFLRQRRSSIHIDRGAANDESARCIIVNMGQQPIFLLAVVVDFGDVDDADANTRAVVTDRDEIAPEDASRPLDRTNKGPLGPGEACDVGSLADLMHRARGRLDIALERRQISKMWVSAVAVSHEGGSLIAATKGFGARHLDGGRTLFEPDTALTKQIQSRFHRKRLLALLDESPA